MNLFFVIDLIIYGKSVNSYFIEERKEKKKAVKKISHIQGSMNWHSKQQEFVLAVVQRRDALVHFK